MRIVYSTTQNNTRAQHLGMVDGAITIHKLLTSLKLNQTYL